MSSPPPSQLSSSPGSVTASSLYSSGEGAKPDQQIASDIDQYLLEDVVIGDRISQGNFGHVYVGNWKGTPVALKRLKVEDQMQLLHEASVLKTLRHPNILQFLGLFINEDSLFLVTEYVTCGNLMHLLTAGREHLKLEDKIKIMYDVCLGMTYLEDQNVIHRDLAARNLLFTVEVGDYKVKLSDFGHSVIADDDGEFNGDIRKPPFKRMAPEIIKDQVYSNKSDVWAFGIVFWEVLSNGDKPFDSVQGPEEIYALLQKGERPQIPADTPPDIKAVMEDCWEWDPAKRPKFCEIIPRMEKLLEKYRPKKPDIAAECILKK